MMFGSKYVMSSVTKAQKRDNLIKSLRKGNLKETLKLNLTDIDSLSNWGFTPLTLHLSTFYLKRITLEHFEASDSDIKGVRRAVKTSSKSIKNLTIISRSSFRGINLTDSTLEFMSILSASKIKVQQIGSHYTYTPFNFSTDGFAKYKRYLIKYKKEKYFSNNNLRPVTQADLIEKMKIIAKYPDIYSVRDLKAELKRSNMAKPEREVTFYKRCLELIKN